jgi:hypothetical protein
MNMNPSKILGAAITLYAGIISLYAADSPKAPHIDPATGLWTTNNAVDSKQGAHIDPHTGIPVVKATGDLSPDDKVNAGAAAHAEVYDMISNGHYEGALQRCLSFRARVKGNTWLVFLLPDWIELGRRFPKAREAMIEIRDQDAREFSEGRGYSELFQELAAINGQIENTDATYALFKTIREKDPALARQCAIFIEGLLAEKEGTPFDRFDVIQRQYEVTLNVQKRWEEQKQRMAEINMRLGFTNRVIVPDHSAERRKYAEDAFVEQTRGLIASLVAKGQKADAEKIRDRSLAILNDGRLRTAVTDAGQRLAK